jgi:uncharacterized membrane protein (Fun14 family)
MNKQVYQSNGAGSQVQKSLRVVHAVKTMPRWKWKLLGLGLIIGILGVLGQGAVMLNNGSPSPAAPVAHSEPNAMPAAGPRTPVVSTVDALGNTPPPTFTQLMTPFLTHVGFSLFVGVILGLMFRTFLRMALLFTALVVGGAMALSYFHVMNVDLTAVQTDTARATSWLADQGYRVRDMLFHALPCGTSAGLGFILGFKKR